MRDLGVADVGLALEARRGAPSVSTGMSRTIR